MGESLAERLKLEGAKVRWWKTGAEALRGLSELTADAVICDIRLPDRSGADVFRSIARNRCAPPFLFITGYGDVEQAVCLMREGARDYLTKPFVMSEFLSRLEQVIGSPEAAGDPVLGVSQAMRELEQFLQRAARVNSNLLLTGETGVGKEVCARYLHTMRDKPNGPFMALNCAAMPADLMESELFGHEKGAFTGAHVRHLGYAERAGQGVLFLDEITELAPKAAGQTAARDRGPLLSPPGRGAGDTIQGAAGVCDQRRFAQEHSSRGLPRRPLLPDQRHRPRRPAVRDRVDDVEWLIDRLFAEFARTIESDAVGISALACEAAREHSWPGNVRELRNRIERAVALAVGRWIMPVDLFPERSDRRCGGKQIHSLAWHGARGCREASHSAGTNNDRRCHPPRGEGAWHFAYDAVGENEALWPSRFRRVNAMCG